MIPRGILLHRCETGATGAAVKAAEAKQGLGYHFFIRRDGTVDALYPPSDVVWHALTWSRSCIGIALHGDFHPPDKSRNCLPTAAQKAALITLVLDLWKAYGVLPLMGHTDLPGASTDPQKVCPGANLDVRALQAQTFAAHVLLISSGTASVGQV